MSSSEFDSDSDGIELEIRSPPEVITSPTAAEQPADAPLVPAQMNGAQQRLRITGYRILVTVVTVVLGSLKAFAASRGTTLTTNTLDWVIGIIVTMAFFWLGEWRDSAPPAYAWLFHRDYSWLFAAGGRYISREIKQASDSLPAGILSILIFSPSLICIFTGTPSLVKRVLLWIAFFLVNSVLGYFANLAVAFLIRYLERSRLFGRLVRVLRTHAVLVKVLVVVGMFLPIFHDVYYRYCARVCKALGYW